MNEDLKRIAKNALEEIDRINKEIETMRLYISRPNVAKEIKGLIGRRSAFLDIIKLIPKQTILTIREELTCNVGNAVKQ